MPPKPKNQNEINAERRKIMDASLDIIAKKGFSSLTMRKIASRVGMSATNIYNYFHNKDEVYLSILTEGFDLLYKELYDASKLGQNPKESLEHVIKAFVDFGLSKVYYYEIMFSKHTPKYFNYIGQPLEKIAFHEKKVALKALNLLIECISKNFSQNSNNHDINFKLLTLRIISSLHGILNLHHNRVLIEVCDNPLEFIDNTVEHLIQELNDLV